MQVTPNLPDIGHQISLSLDDLKVLQHELSCQKLVVQEEVWSSCPSLLLQLQGSTWVVLGVLSKIDLNPPEIHWHQLSYDNKNNN